MCLCVYEIVYKKKLRAQSFSPARNEVVFFFFFYSLSCVIEKEGGVGWILKE
jgi:hypothetical protein